LEVFSTFDGDEGSSGLVKAGFCEASGLAGVVSPGMARS
jgi:hypothetical protein